LNERYRGRVNSGIVGQECEATVPFDHGIKELLDRSVVGHIGDLRVNPGSLKSSVSTFRPARTVQPAGAQRNADGLADTAAASGDYRGSHVV
jgi:hypothetical protein